MKSNMEEKKIEDQLGQGDDFDKKIAGGSMQRVEFISTELNEIKDKDKKNAIIQAIEENSYSECPHESFKLRIGPNYNKNKKKEASNESLYDLVGIE